MTATPERAALISFYGRQTLPFSDESDEMEFLTDGVFSRKGRSFFISYRESELTGIEGAVTTLQVEPRRVTMTRLGEDGGTSLVFEQGRKHMSHYDIPMGSLLVGISAQRVGVDLSDAGGEVQVDYSVEVDHAYTGENNIRIRVRPRGQGEMVQ